MDKIIGIGYDFLCGNDDGVRDVEISRNRREVERDRSIGRMVGEKNERIGK